MRIITADGELIQRHVPMFGIVAMLYCLVSSGAFGIEEIVPTVGPGMTIALLVLVPIVWSLPICMMVSECNACIPAEGGLYKWSKTALGDFWGFQVGWWTAASMFISSAAYIALAASYTGQLLCLDGVGLFLVKACIVVLLVSVNLLGLEHVLRMDLLFAAAIAIVFGTICVVGYMGWKSDPLDPFSADISNSSISGGMLLTMWMYCGFESVAAIAGEMRNPLALSRGLLIALLAISTSYVLPTLASLAYLPSGSWANWGLYDGIGSPASGYVSVLEMAFGSPGELVFLLTAIFSQLAIYASYLTTGSRTIYAAAQDGLAPRVFSKLSPSRSMPYVGIAVLAICSVALSELGFANLVELESVFIMANYLVLTFTVVKLRTACPINKREHGARGTVPFRTGGLFFCVASLLLVISFALVVSDFSFTVYGLSALATGIVAYVFVDWKRKKSWGRVFCVAGSGQGKPRSFGRTHMQIETLLGGEADAIAGLVVIFIACLYFRASLMPECSILLNGLLAILSATPNVPNYLATLWAYGRFCLLANISLRCSCGKG